MPPCLPQPSHHWHTPLGIGGRSGSERPLPGAAPFIPKSDSASTMPTSPERIAVTSADAIIGDHTGDLDVSRSPNRQKRTDRGGPVHHTGSDQLVLPGPPRRDRHCQRTSARATHARPAQKHPRPPLPGCGQTLHSAVRVRRTPVAGVRCMRRRQAHRHTPTGPVVTRPATDIIGASDGGARRVPGRRYRSPEHRSFVDRFMRPVND